MKITITQDEIAEAVSASLAAKGFTIPASALTLVPTFGGYEHGELESIAYVADIPGTIPLKRQCPKCMEKSNQTTCPKCVKPTKQIA